MKWRGVKGWLKAMRRRTKNVPMAQAVKWSPKYRSAYADRRRKTLARCPDRRRRNVERLELALAAAKAARVVNDAAHVDRVKLVARSTQNTWRATRRRVRAWDRASTRVRNLTIELERARAQGAGSGS